MKMKKSSHFYRVKLLESAQNMPRSPLVSPITHTWGI